MTPRLAIAALAAALALPALAQAPQKVVAEKSQIRFVFKQMNVPVEGRFRKFDATVAFDPKKPEATKAEFEVDLGSIDLGNPEGETEAKRKPWLNIDAFPKAKFVAAVGEGHRAPASTRPPARSPSRAPRRTSPRRSPCVDAGGMRTVEGQFALKRLQFKIGEGPWADTDTVADEVAVRFKFVIPSTK